jgi:MYXO-CTERM domain-containing protein
MGLRACVGGVAQAPELCNGIDDNCNGVVDDVPGIGLPCSDPSVIIRGPCTAAFACSGAPGPGPNGLTCTQLVGPQPEICNGVDDDCNGVVDDPAAVAANDKRIGVAGGPPCTALVPLPNTVFPVAGPSPPCNPGTTACKNGAIVCQGEVGPTPNLCGQAPSDCTGVAGTGMCPTPLTCFQGMCAVNCQGEQGAFFCPGGYVCDQVAGLCVPDQCPKLNCPSGFDCVIASDGSASCVDPCSRVNCPAGYVCKLGACVDITCRAMPCPAGTRCAGSPVPSCQPDPCFHVTCNAGEFCDSKGMCVHPCTNCQKGEVCIDGVCMANPCLRKECPAGQLCAVVLGAAMCVDDMCGGGCGSGLSCCTGMCVSSPCNNVTCMQGFTCAVDPSCNPTCVVQNHDNITASGGGGAGCTCSVAARADSGPAWTVLALLGLGALRGRRARMRG